ncbi:hypothetical protein [Tuwongella immobilis]|uniref:Uncharacterized protein n=1 Tax=Tuwongella immobilis TaxID=692036 RepID=A0A6C2YVL0_9BACT|nr:hypothetical protein [Tuwongella immobilis]VIP04945.1 unnamed protein product [Tuwongella immobilis]VTS07248.1 unnamed protein product [Tuwongella immobilis]
MRIIRLLTGIAYLLGGWFTATGLRQNQDPELWLGIGLIALGLLVESIRNAVEANHRRRDGAIVSGNSSDRANIDG